MQKLINLCADLLIDDIRRTHEQVRIHDVSSAILEEQKNPELKAFPQEI